MDEAKTKNKDEEGKDKLPSTEKTDDVEKVEETTQGKTNKDIKSDNEEYSMPEKLDELSSLEQEIAKMHSNTSAENAPTEQSTAGPRGAPSASSVNSEIHKLGVEREIADVTPEQALEETAALLAGNDSCLDKAIAVESNAPLEDADLIAVLKGTDTLHDQVDELKQLVIGESDSLDVGVTIEGEGQFEIMEIVDDDVDDHQEIVSPKKSINVPKRSSSKTKMSPEEERAVAMEQIANLRPKQSRRKQELKQESKQSDIVSSLNDDWNEYDSGDDLAAPKVKRPEKKTKVIKNIKEVITNISENTKPAKGFSSPNIHVGKSEKVQENTSDLTSIIGNVVIESRTGAATPDHIENTGFKRTRVIKRKIIWDPDVPETQKSYSQYATSKSTSTPTSKPVPPKTITPVTESIPNKKETQVKKIRPTTPKDKIVSEPIQELTPKHTTPPLNATTKRRSQTPSVLSNGTAGVKKKKVSSEIDRLMGDEGAASMIQDVEHKRRSALDNSNEIEVHRPIMRKRALTICEKPPKLEEQLKKESPPKNKRPVVVKSRAADTWDYVYKQQAMDDAMIIRRRSNSSYSSSASLRRLSIDKANMSDTEPLTGNSDTDETFKFAKPENKSSTTLKGNRRDNSPIMSDSIAVDMKREIRANSVTRGNAADKANKDSTTDVSLRKVDKIAHVVINAQRAKIPNTYGLQLLNKLTETLAKISKSNEYNTVLITSTGAQFCHGIDFHDLTVGSLEKRKNHASQFSTAVKTYLKTLATFPKPIVVGVNGNLKNLGVMQLPLFDYVVSSDRCTFETSYAKFGQLPEGLCFWQAAPVTSTVRKRFFLLCEKMSLSEIGGTSSLINKTTTSSKVYVEALLVARKISETSAENYYNCVKKYTNSNHLETLKSLDEEFKTINEQWISNKLIDKLKCFIEQGGF